jgi:SAM-dependent methyltransferase
MMEAYQEDTYGERISGVYDDWYGGYDEAAIQTLHALAGGGRALELGIGTGRIALPLQQAGVEVHGIDASEAMVTQLRRKPGGDRIPVSMGNFADLAVDGKFSLIYVPFNTFFALLEQEEQVRCFQNVAAHLTPDGVFVIEAFIPDLARFSAGRQTLRATSMDNDELRFDASILDPLRQQITSQHVVLSGQGVRLYPVKLRFVWPAEMDLMARLAGMRLRQRWGGWAKEAFTAESGRHISVYGF